MTPTEIRAVAVTDSETKFSDDFRTEDADCGPIYNVVLHPHYR
jgi:hypothetical protein